MQQLAGNEAVSLAVGSHGLGAPLLLGIQRQKQGASNQRAYVVRDESIDAGGSEYVSDLATLKTRLMATKSTREWMLVISIHGSEERVAAQKGPDMQKNAIFYESADLRAIFGTPDFVAWRKAHGPSRLILVACQLSSSFERTIQSLLLKSGKPRAGSLYGLGKGCKPIAATTPYERSRKSKSGETWVKVDSWKKYRQMPESERTAMLAAVRELNSEWGYFGGPPVPVGDVLHWFFDETPKGGWPCVKVEIGGQPTDIPYWNRNSGPKAAEYRRACKPELGQLRRRPSYPPAS
jgi:hypothetical protein